MNKPPKPMSIEDYGGLRPFLDATADLHNGVDYEKYMEMRQDPEYAITKISRKMGFYSTNPIYRYIAYEQKETGNASQ